MIRPPCLRHIHHENGHPGQQPQGQQPGHRAEPLRARQPQASSSLVCGAHFATTAQIAIAAESRPMRTGTIIW